MFSTNSCGFATCFRPAFDFFCRKPCREPAAYAAGSLVRARARQMECRKKPVLSKFAAGFQHAFDLFFATSLRHAHATLRPGLQPGLQLARIIECRLYTAPPDTLVEGYK